MKRYLSLRYKLAALIGVGGVFTALIAAAGFTWLDLDRYQQSSNAQVSAIATIIADQVGPAISLGDRRAAGEILNTLCASRIIREASLYDERGACFSAARPSTGGCPARPPVSRSW